jgi:hypothetical protein
VTHGHPRALVGAVLHAVALTFVLERGVVPEPQDWPELLDITHHAVGAFSRIEELAHYWRPQWERVAKQDLEQAWHQTVAECEQLLESVRQPLDGLRRAPREKHHVQSAYEQVVRELGLDDERLRGSATSTVVASLVVAATYPADAPAAARLASSRVGTDTDTIATMAAALVGAADPRELPSALQDSAYIAREAQRLARIAKGATTSVFPYPDLLKWVPPKSALEGVGTVDGGLALAGLGRLRVFGDTYQNRSELWLWAHTSFGSTALVKLRSKPRELPRGNWPTDREQFAARPAVKSPPDHSTGRRGDNSAPEPPRLFDELEPSRSDPTSSAWGRLYDFQVIRPWLAEQGFADQAIGYAFRRVAKNGSADQLDRFVTAVVRELKRRN